MQIVFFSNFLNHHQLPFCERMIQLCGEDNFVFVATEPSNPVCIKLGYEEMNDKYSFVLKTYESPENMQKALELALICDVALIGGNSEQFKDVRLRHNKLTFVFTERLLKESSWSILNPHVFVEIFRRFTRYVFKPCYVLCASGFTAGDLALAGFPRKKCFKWGYFPAVERVSDVNEIIRQKQGLKRQDVSILWVARLIGWKHPELPVQLAERLNANGYRFNLTMLGNGEMEQEVKQLIQSKRLENCVHYLGAKSYREVREFMRESDIFLFTSDRNEGWGAVLNEAMNSACAVVANRNIGSVPFMLQDGINGLKFDGSLDSLYEKTVQLIMNKELKERLSINAYHTMVEHWNAENAASNLLKLIDNIRCGRHNNIEYGPCSNA